MAEPENIVIVVTHVQPPPDAILPGHRWQGRAYLNGECIENGRFFSLAGALDEALCALAGEGVEVELEVDP